MPDAGRQLAVTVLAAQAADITEVAQHQPDPVRIGPGQDELRRRPRRSLARPSSSPAARITQ